MSPMRLAALSLIAGLSGVTGCSSSGSDSPLGSAADGGAQNSGGLAAGASAAGAPSTAAGAPNVGGATSPGSGGSNDAAAGASGSFAGGPAGVSGTSNGGTSNGGNTSGGSTGGSSGTAGKGGAPSTGTCTASKPASAKASGSGPHQVTIETNSDPGIKEGTIFRPSDLGGSEKYPIFVWGEGGCSLNGLSNSAAMAEVASHGYFVIADGTPNNSNSREMDESNPAAMGAPLLAYVSWAIAENDKSCSPYHQALDTTKVAANGFSCGGLMAEGTAGDPRITTWGINSSGLFSANQQFYKTIHTPVLIVLGGSSDIAYTNGERDFDSIGALGTPIFLFSKQLGHGGDLFAKNGGDFTKIDLAWLNWQLKGDLTATGKGALVGSSCAYCSNSAWEVKTKNAP